MNNCIVEKLKSNVGNGVGFKVYGAGTASMHIINVPSSTIINNGGLLLKVTWSNNNGSVKAIGDCFFVDDPALNNHPMSYYEDINNSIGTEFNNLSSFNHGISNKEGGYIIGNKYNVTELYTAGLVYDTIDLLGYKSVRAFALSNNNLENVDFSKVFDYCPSLTSIKTINGDASINLNILKKCPLLQVVRLHNNPEVQKTGFGGHYNYNTTGDIVEIAELLNLVQFDAYYTAVHGDFYDVVEAYRLNGRTSGHLTSQNIGRQNLLFNGHTLTNKVENTIVWDSTHAYIALNTNNATTLQGKTRIYYIGYTAQEVATMKQGLWSGLTDANIIDCSDGGE